MKALIETGEVVEVTSKGWITSDGRCFSPEQLKFCVPEGVAPTNDRKYQTALAIYKMIADWCIDRDEKYGPRIAHNDKIIQLAISYADTFLKELNK